MSHQTRALIALVVATFPFSATAAGAADVRLAWLPVHSAAGYRAYMRDPTEPYSQGLDVGPVPADADGIVRWVIRDVALDVPHYFAVTSYDAEGAESRFSNELVLKPPLLCAPAPIADCRAPTVPGASILLVRNAAQVRWDRLGWKWRKGADISAGDLGYPPVDTNYVLCIYDDFRGVARLAMGVQFPLGGTCINGRPCWRELGSRGIIYENRSVGARSLLKLKLKRGAAGRATIQVSGKGASLAFPDPVTSPLFRQDPTVTVQLVNDAIPSVCWEASYSADARTHTATLFKDTSD